MVLQYIRTIQLVSIRGIKNEIKKNSISVDGSHNGSWHNDGLWR